VADETQNKVGDLICERERAEQQRDFNAAVYSAVQRASLDGILLVDSQDKILSYNQRFVEIWGIPPELIADKSDSRLLEAVAAQVTDREAFIAQVKELYADIDGTNRDEISLKDGRTLDRYSAPVRLDDGRYVGRVWFFRDVTAHKRAEDTIREDATQFRGLVEQQIAGIFIVTIDGTLAYVNPRFVELLGYTPAEVIGHPFIDVIADKDKDTVRKAFAEHFEAGPPTTQTFTTLTRKDGGLVDVAAHTSLASYHDKPALIGLVVDITEEKRATDLLRTSEERFRLQVEEAPDAILLYDVDSARFVNANKSATALFGCTRDEIIEGGPLQFFLSDLSDERSLPVSFDEHNARALAGLESVFERRFRNARGREGICQVTLVRLPTVGGRLLRASLVDITERRRSELALAYRDRILHAVTLSVAVLVAAPDLAAGMPQALQTAAQALQVDRILILERSTVAAATPAITMAYAWQTAEVPVLDATILSRISGDAIEFGAWLAPLLEGKPVITYATKSGGAIGRIMREMHNLSTLLVPIFVAGKCWGHLGIDDCNVERQWESVEIDTLGTLAQVIGSLIVREQTQASLKNSEEQMTYLAGHDSLTGLVNRTVFVDALQQAIARARRSGESFAVFYIDLDHFKDVNDTLGHPVGDLLLQSVADRVRTSVRETDTVGRFGGDEFALIQSDVPQPVDAAMLANKLLKALNEPFKIQGNEIRSGASIGIAVYGPDSSRAEILLSHADVALYRAKSEGRGTYRFFTDAMDVEMHTRVTLGSDLRDGMESGQLFLMYQPQIDVDTGCFVGVEALARWLHPIRGLVPPSIFIPLAEQNGVIVALGRWVLRAACRQMREWIDAGIAPPLISVNVSALQFKTPFELENEIAAILKETALPPQCLELEVTESVLMDTSREHNDALLRLRKAGHRIAIDDFGTGYSSLEYLGRFPVDRIKIAESFIVDLTNATGNSVIVKAAIGLAHELNLDVVVEGVESAEQLEQVRSWGCRKMQGYYFSRPLSALDLAPLLRAAKVLPAGAAHY
jgi:diguanylate cyclase (GGDEF)-like protein/PAS domain S-box-containing protein